MKRVYRNGRRCQHVFLIIFLSNRIKRILISLILSFFLVCINASDILAASISFTSVPDYGSHDNLMGTVEGDDCKVAVWILIDGLGWWPKPFSNSFVLPDANGNWECDITTGGVDEYSVKITAYLLPDNYNPTIRSKEEDERNSIAHKTATRSARTLFFSGYMWAVKSSVDKSAGKSWKVDPGQNYFSHDQTSAWVDPQGRLHLKIKYEGGKWYCAEVRCLSYLGYGQYRFYLSAGFENMDQNAVLGLFTFDDETSPPYREIDIEFSRWGDAQNDNAQYVIQPWHVAGNRHRYNIQYNGLNSSHRFDWNPHRIVFDSKYSDNTFIQNWNYTGTSVPKSGLENVRMNLWLNGQPPSDGKEIEVIIEKFEFKPSFVEIIAPSSILLLDSE